MIVVYVANDYLSKVDERLILQVDERRVYRKRIVRELGIHSILR
jgi:hypothetical protein